MNNNRRQFIKTAGIVGAGVGVLGLGGIRAFGGVGGLGSVPGLADMDGIEGWNAGGRFPRMTPESQGVSSQAIRKFVEAAGASGISWHSFMLLRHGQVVAEG